MTSWEQWVTNIDAREFAYISTPPLDTIERRNTHLFDRLTDGLVKRCGNPFCKWPIKHIRDRDYTAPFYGDVCATCHDLFSAITIMNPFLKNTKYFYDAHDAWVKELEAVKKSRRNMGLDENGIP